MNITKYEIIRQHVIDQIFRCLQHDSPIMSEREMCRQFGVTRTTIRKALQPLVEAGTLISRHGAGMYVNKLEYANSMSRFKKIYKIAFFVSNGHISFYSLFLRRLAARISDSFTQENVKLLFNCLTCEPGAEREEIMMYHPDAVIWFRPSRAIQKLLADLRKEIPVCVLLDDGTDRDFSITIDYTESGRRAARWFISRGHRKVALLGTEEETASGSILQQFQKGWKQGWKENGISTNGLLIPQTADFQAFLRCAAASGIDGVFCHASSFSGFSQDWEKVGPPPCPVMTDSSFFSLPENASMLPQYLIDFCSRKLFRHAAEKVLAVIDGKKTNCREFLQPEIIDFNWN